MRQEIFLQPIVLVRIQKTGSPHVGMVSNVCGTATCPQHQARKKTRGFVCNGKESFQITSGS